MSQPAQSLSFEQLQAMERSVFDALGAIGAALGHNLILGMTFQAAPDDEAKVSAPCLTLIFHPEVDGEPPKQLLMTVPQNGRNLLELLAAGAEICAGVLNEYQQKTSRAAGYYQERQAITKARTKKIIMPSRS